MRLRESSVGRAVSLRRDHIPRPREGPDRDTLTWRVSILISVAVRPSGPWMPWPLSNVDPSARVFVTRPSSKPLSLFLRQPD